MFDWVICDSPAGIERGATLAMRFADAAVVVTNPEVSSVRDSDRIIGLLDSKTVRGRARRARSTSTFLLPATTPPRAARGEMLSIDDVLEILSIAAARHHSRERGSAARFEPRLAGDAQQSVERSGRAYLDAARRLMGEERAE